MATTTHVAVATREVESDKDYQTRIDKQILIGSLLLGTMALAPPGLWFMWKAWRLHRQGAAAGRMLRPANLTIIAICCLVDAAVNFLFWGIDLLPTHDTVLGHTFYTGMGMMFDGNYYLGYNTTALGGTGVPSEKALSFGGVLILYPMRLVAAWGFLRMKKWGYQYLVVNNWIYVFFWVTYIAAWSTEFNYRFPFTALGLCLIWGLYIWWVYPFLMIPYLATVNSKLWTED